MERVLPTWLNEAFLATVLEGGEDKEPKVTVLNFTAKLAVAPGNNYLSHIFRVKVEYRVGQAEGQSTTLMVKAPITKGVVSNMSDKMDVFGKELRLYTEVLPRVNEKLNLELNPKAFYCPVKALVLKDMNEEGFFMSDKSKQLDFAHCQLALAQLAKFHAASVACFHEDPAFIRSVGAETMFLEGDMFMNQFKPWLQMCAKTVAATVAGEENCRLGSELLISKCDGLADSAIRLCKPRERGLNVLNHGDFWMNNMLFKHDDSGNVVDVKFIDFQMTRFTSPVQDLVYFVWTSADEDVRKSNLHELFFNTYLKTLNSTLEKLECGERISEEELKEDLKNAIDWGFIAICNVLPMALCEAENAIDLEELSEDELFNLSEDKPDERFMKVFKGKNFNAIIPKVVEHFHLWVSSLN